jgi:hypothetical protein
MTLSIVLRINRMLDGAEIDKIIQGIGDGAAAPRWVAQG